MSGFATAEVARLRASLRALPYPQRVLSSQVDENKLSRLRTSSFMHVKHLYWQRKKEQFDRHAKHQAKTTGT